MQDITPRLRDFNSKPIREGKYVLYWMQQSQRTIYNHALEYAILKANEKKLPLVVCFVLINNFPEANLRHYTFMLEGLKDVKQALSKTASCAIGIKEIKDYLQGRYSLDEVRDLIKKHTRQYAKRQLTWFRKDKRIKWKNAF